MYTAATQAALETRRGVIFFIAKRYGEVSSKSNWNLRRMPGARATSDYNNTQRRWEKLSTSHSGHYGRLGMPKEGDKRRRITLKAEINNRWGRSDVAYKGGAFAVHEAITATHLGLDRCSMARHQTLKKFG